MTLSIGARGPEVVALQKNLLRLGISIADDGVFGPQTKAAVQVFQSVHGLESDGIVGPATQAMIAAMLGICAWTKGLDCSSYQPYNDWAQIAGAGYKFAFLKATEGDYLVDKELPRNWLGTKANGVMRGAYHFFRAGRSGKNQAQFFLNTLPAGSDFAPVLDLETADGNPRSVVIERAQEWLDAVEKAVGKLPIIYTGLGFVDSIGNPEQFAKYPLWCAQYGPSSPSQVRPWTSWTFWQWSESESIPGVKGLCDANWFNGTIQQLKNGGL